MVGVPYDCLSNPLGAVRLTFEKAASAAGAAFDPAALAGKDWGVIDLFRTFLFDQCGLDEVPLLDQQSIGLIPPNSLVRFRGMVQDMLGNEMYVGAFKDETTWRTNKFADTSLKPIDDSCEMHIWERRLLHCVPVPGLNSWTIMPSSAESLRNRYNRGCMNRQGEKRQREFTEESSYDASSDLSSNPKKQREHELSNQDMTTEFTGSFRNEQMMSNFNLSPSCLVKMYDMLETDTKLNEVFEFVGVLTFDPELATHMNDPSEDVVDLCEDVLAHFPPIKVPRLHCLIHRRLAAQDFFQLSSTIEPTSSVLKDVRASLLTYLTTVLGNDGLAAHCLLLHLLSKVYVKVDTVCVGKLSVNFSGFTGESISLFGTQLRTALCNLLPYSQYMSLSVEYLNTATLAPQKNYQTNRLVTGALQLAQGTHLTIDETQMESGKLSSAGISNVRVLKNLFDHQNVEYDFNFYKLEMPAEFQLLVLSEGKSNILPADMVVPFHPAAVIPAGNPSPEQLQAWRWYIATVKSCLVHEIKPDIQEVIENDMVAARQEDRSLSAYDFSRWLTMARLVSTSFGETNLSLEHWQLVKELERLRMERIQVK